MLKSVLMIGNLSGVTRMLERRRRTVALASQLEYKDQEEAVAEQKKEPLEDAD